MKRTSTHSRKAAKPVFELLENRQLMSASPFVINGTNGNDVITVNFGTQLVVSENPTGLSTQSTAAQTPATGVKATTAVTATAKAGVGAAAPVIATIAPIKAPITPIKTPIGPIKAPISPIKAPVGPIVKTPVTVGPIVSTIFDKLTYTINGVTATTYLQNGQGIVINGLDGNDMITVTGKVNAQINGGSGNDTLIGGAGNDSIYGGDGNDLIRAGTGNDLLDGGAGDDIIYGGSGSSNAYGDDGNDQFFAGSGRFNMYGGNGDDIMVSIGGNAADQQWGDAGNNSYWLGAGQSAMDPTAAEKATNVHVVKGYDGLHVNGTYVGTPSLAPGIGGLPDPSLTSNLSYKSFASTPLFSNTPIPADVNQGTLGDCYFMATLSAVAKTDPNAIEQSVVSLGDGTYAVDFKQNGADHFIRVDADLPVNSSGHLIYAHWDAEPAAMWVPIMEKAWAFFRTGAGTYASTENGFPSDVFSALGVSNNSYNPHHEGFLDLQSENANDFANHMNSLLSSGDTVVLCTPPDSSYLEDSHCYLLDHVTEVGGKITSITIRNPWGTDGRGGNGPNDGYITMTSLDVLNSIDLVTYGKA